MICCQCINNVCSQHSEVEESCCFTLGGSWRNSATYDGICTGYGGESQEQDGRNFSTWKLLLMVVGGKKIARGGCVYRNNVFESTGNLVWALECTYDWALIFSTLHGVPDIIRYGLGDSSALQGQSSTISLNPGTKRQAWLAEHDQMKNSGIANVSWYLYWEAMQVGGKKLILKWDRVGLDCC